MLAGLPLGAAGPLGAAEPLSTEQALAGARRGELLLVDIRSAGEWALTGLPEGAVAITFQDWLWRPRAEFAAELLAALGGDRDRPVALICATGGRSAAAAELLAGAGFSRVHDVPEGMLGSAAGPGWLRRGLPVRPCADC